MNYRPASPEERQHIPDPGGDLHEHIGKQLAFATIRKPTGEVGKVGIFFEGHDLEATLRSIPDVLANGSTVIEVVYYGLVSGLERLQ